MTTSFLSDADAWLCVCAARLAELQGLTGPRDTAACDTLAGALLAQPAYAAMDPVAAAAAYLQALTARAA